MRRCIVVVTLGFFSSAPLFTLKADAPNPGLSRARLADDLRGRMQSVIETSMAKASSSFPESLAYLETEARKLQTEFPETAEPFELLISTATFSDPEKARLLAQEIVSSKVAAADQNIAWSQYFDEKGRAHALAGRFNVQALPTMWLVDKNGVLPYLNAGNDLEGKIKSLLAE